MKYKVLFVAPVSGNGGIVSWAKQLLNNFFDEEFVPIHVNVSERRSSAKHKGSFIRYIDGLLDMFTVLKRLKHTLKKEKPSLMHTTTSGNIGTLRDYAIVKLCHRYNIPCILHCHYGCISIDIKKKGPLGGLLRKTLYSYDAIWVLDRYSFEALNTYNELKEKVFITPNPIEVPASCDLSPKKYDRIAFVGNLIPSKGLFELVHAVADNPLKVGLIIAGPGPDEVVHEIIRIAGNKFGKSISYVGRLSNVDAVKLIKSVDMISLASYYSSEAFPISILEAMSYGKLVIATRRAAIQDMLTDNQGEECGFFVKEKSIEDIAKAIQWCQDHSEEADRRCAAAYEKVKTCYNTNVVYQLYRGLYKNLIRNS